MKARFALIAIAMIALGGGCGQNGSAGEQAAESASLEKGIDRSRAGRPLPDKEIANAEGKSASLASMSGEPLLVNLWATWCAPCVKELPTLQALGSREGAPRVIAVSQDVAPRGSVDAFLERHRLDGLEVWHDSQMALSGALGAEVLPTTILYDAQGREVWRYVGDLDWAGEEAAKLLEEASAGGKG